MRQYYIVINQQSAGPYTIDQLANYPQFTPETLVFTEGMSNWTPAGQLEDFAALFASRMAPAQQELAPYTPEEKTQVYYPESPKEKSNTKVIIISVVAALLLIGGGVAAYFLWFNKPARHHYDDEDEDDSPKTEQVAETADTSNYVRNSSDEAEATAAIEALAEEIAEAAAEPAEEAIYDPQNSIGVWRRDNTSRLAKVKRGNRVQLRTFSYSYPMFDETNCSKVLNNNEYTIYCDYKGGVYAYNASKGTYFIIYLPTKGTSSPTNVYYEDSYNDMMVLDTYEGRFLYDVRDDYVTNY